MPLDGFEVYYPKHTPEQTAMFADYAAAHGLLSSAGSDSHSVEQPPIKYQAAQARSLLERLGVRVAAPSPSPTAREWGAMTARGGRRGSAPSPSGRGLG